MVSPLDQFFLTLKQVNAVTVREEENEEDLYPLCNDFERTELALHLLNLVEDFAFDHRDSSTKPTPPCFNTCYGSVYNICYGYKSNDNIRNLIYKLHCETITYYLINKMRPSFEDSLKQRNATNSNNQDELSIIFRNQWNRYRKFCKVMNDIFFCLDRHLSKQVIRSKCGKKLHRKFYSLDDTTIALFCDLVYGPINIQHSNLLQHCTTSCGISDYKQQQEHIRQHKPHHRKFVRIDSTFLIDMTKIIIGGPPKPTQQEEAIKITEKDSQILFKTLLKYEGRRKKCICISSSNSIFEYLSMAEQAIVRERDAFMILPSFRPFVDQIIQCIEEELYSKDKDGLLSNFCDEIKQVSERTKQLEVAICIKS